MPRLLSIALTSPPYATLSYALPEWLPADAFAAGTRVAVPLGGNGQNRVGVVLGDSGDSMPDGVTAKPVLWVLEREPLLSVEYLDMIRQLAVRYSSTEGEILGNLLPAALRTTQIRFRVLGDGRPKTLKLRDVSRMANSERALLGKQWLAGNVTVLDAEFDPDAAEICTILQDPPWSVRPSAKRQIEVLELLWERGSMSRRLVLKELGQPASAALNTLAERGLISVGLPEDSGSACELVCADSLSSSSSSSFSTVPANSTATVDAKASAAAATAQTPTVDDNKYSGQEGPTSKTQAGCADTERDDLKRGFALVPAQKAALESFEMAMDSEGAETRLLYGVTGSGKTAVYLELAAAALRRGKSVMLLAPEVALACKLDRALRESFPDQQVFFYHGYQSPAERDRTFRALARRSAPCLVAGTRSALFLPVPALGAVVLDEEHDSSFKQDEGLVYQAKEIAHYRIGQVSGLLVLGSATPDIKTFHAARNGVIPVLAMGERVGGGTLPDIELVDIKGMNSTDSSLAPKSLEALREVVSAGDQAVILLNRRGYAPLMYCLDCGEVAKCPHCEIGLTYHKGRERLVCHYCGHSVPYPATCTKCKGLHFLPMGEGTEKLEEELAHVLPEGSGVLRLDRDSTRRPGRMEAILDAFARKEAQVLVGTQMLSKGHHFPDVTLAIVADGDLGLNLPDYRAAERTFQLLVQSAGRAGRGSKPGRVFIQTRDPAHYCWEYIRTADYDGFYEQEITRRQRYKYPPFMKLALIRLSFPFDWKEGGYRLNDITAFVREKGKERGVRVLGPAPSPLPLIRGRKRFQCLLKADDWRAIRGIYAELRNSLPRKSPMRISLDLDPVNML